MKRQRNYLGLHFGEQEIITKVTTASWMKGFLWQCLPACEGAHVCPTVWKWFFSLTPRPGPLAGMMVQRDNGFWPSTDQEGWTIDPCGPFGFLL